jgi:hypothetical protein
MKISRSDARFANAAILGHLLAPPATEAARIARPVAHFVRRGHACIVLGLLGANLLSASRSRRSRSARRGVVRGDIKRENAVLFGAASAEGF